MPNPPPARLLRLVFHGQCLQGHDPQAVRHAVARALKLDDARAEHLFSGRRVVLRRGVDEETALRFVARFRHLGAVLHAEPADAAPGTAAPARAPRAASHAASHADSLSDSRADSRVDSRADSRADPPASASLPAMARPSPRMATASPVRKARPEPTRQAPSRTAAAAAGVLAAGALAWLLGGPLLGAWQDWRALSSRQAVTAAAGAQSTAGAATALPPPAAPSQPAAAAPAASVARAVRDDELPADMGPAARIDYRQHYLPLAGHKAFALGGQVHEWHAGAASEDEARDTALTRCMQQLSTAGGSCRIIDANGELTE